MNTYTFKGIKGRDDLKSAYPYHGEWPIFSAYYGITEEEYKANPQAYAARIIKDNNEYIKKLMQDGELGKEYEIKIEMEENAAFDNVIPTDFPLESYKMIMVDYDK